MKFRKKPIVIDAYQWLPDENQEQMPPAPDYLLRARTRFGRHIGWELKTLEGWYVLTPGDYLICGIKGEWYPCKPDVFHATYEPEI